MEKKLPFFIALITMCCLHLPAFPAKAVDKDWTFDPKTSSLIPKYLGKVKALSGKAIIGERELQKGSKIYNNELVQTSEKSFVVIEMIDLTVITLGPKSDFKVEKWDYRTKNDRDAVFSVIKGQWRALIKSKSKKDDQIKINTSLISMGVRGTELLVNVNNIGDKEINQVAVLEGRVHLEGDLPKNMKKDLVAGDYAVIEKNATEVNQKEKILSPTEMKSYQQFIAPEVLRLLDPIAFDSTSTDKKASSQSQVTNDKLPETASPPSNSNVPSSAYKSLEENLKILNTIREENLKSK